MPVEPIKTRRLYQEVANQLLQLIADGEFSPGDRLPSERDLAAGLQVSRPTIREAMIALELAGAIQIRTGAGIFVSQNPYSLSDQDGGPGPFELLEARLFIEGEAAALAAERITDEEIKELSKANRQMEKLTELHRPTEEVDLLFHLTISRATRNSAMEAAIDQLWDFRSRMPMWRGLHQVIHEIEKRNDWSDDRRAVLDHREIIDALTAHDPGKARKAMRAHLERVSNALMAASELKLIDITSDNYLTTKE